MSGYDAVVVGAGPNGLAAAIVLARAGLSVLVREANSEVGGAVRTEELTLPGYLHDTFSTVYPLGIGSPFLQTLPLREYGLEWIQSPVAVAHPFEDGTAALLERSVEDTARTLGGDGAAYRGLVEYYVESWDRLLPELLAPLHLPLHPVLMARFGMRGLRSADGLARSSFRGDRARALFGGSAAHSGLPLDARATAAFGLVLTLAGHAVGWPIAEGGAGNITRAMAAYFRSLGGEIQMDARVRSLDELPDARAVLLDLTPRQILAVAGPRLSPRYRKQLEGFRYGAGAFRVDWALDGPIPWTAAECGRAATVHVVGSYAELLESERGPWHGRVPERPFVLVVQPTLFDSGRAPAGKHTAWAYCHLPNDCPLDVTDRIESQVERFAPGFRDLVLARYRMSPRDLEGRDENLVGGDFNGGAPTLGQLFFRPTVRADPYFTGARGIYVCSASTPPSGGVHGMCGYHAARSALKREFGGIEERTATPST